MKRLICLVAAMAFLAFGSLAMARDANQDSLQQQWKQQKAEHKKIEAQLKAGETDAKSLPGDVKAVPSPKKDK